MARKLHTFLLLLVIHACNFGLPGNQHPDLVKANDIREQALEIAAGLQGDLKQLVQLKNQINLQGRILYDKEITFVNQVEGLETKYEVWKEQDIEIPGFENEITDNSSTAMADRDMDPAEILEMQKTSLHTIQNLDEEIALTYQLLEQVREL